VNFKAETASNNIRLVNIVEITITSIAANDGYEKSPSVYRKYAHENIMIGYGIKINDKENRLNYFQFTGL